MNDRILLLCEALRDEATIIKRGTERLKLAGDDPEIAFTIEKIRMDSVAHAQRLILDISKEVSEEAEGNPGNNGTDKEIPKNEAPTTS